MLLLVSSLPRWLTTLTPQFKILWPVIVFDAVLMMYCFVGLKITAQHFLHHKSVLSHIFSCVALTIRMVWAPYQHIATAIDFPLLPPRAVLAPECRWVLPMELPYST